MVAGFPWDYSLSESLGMTTWFFILLLSTRQQRDLLNGIGWHDRVWPPRVRALLWPSIGYVARNAVQCSHRLPVKILRSSALAITRPTVRRRGGRRAHGPCMTAIDGAAWLVLSVDNMKTSLSG